MCACLELCCEFGIDEYLGKQKVEDFIERLLDCSLGSLTMSRKTFKEHGTWSYRKWQKQWLIFAKKKAPLDINCQKEFFSILTSYSIFGILFQCVFLSKSRILSDLFYQILGPLHRCKNVVINKYTYFLVFYRLIVSPLFSNFLLEYFYAKHVLLCIQEKSKRYNIFLND